MSDVVREIDKYHDGRYRSIDVVYLCGEIGNPDKERAYVPLDRVLEFINDALDIEETARKAKWNKVTMVRQLKDRVLALKEGVQSDQAGSLRQVR